MADFTTREFETNAEAVGYAWEAETAGYSAIVDLQLVEPGDRETWIVDIYIEDPEPACLTCGTPLDAHDPFCLENVIDEATDAALDRKYG